MKLPLFAGAIVCGVAVLIGVCWMDRRTLSELRAQLAESQAHVAALQQRAIDEATARGREAKAAALAIEALKDRLSELGGSSKNADAKQRALELEIARIRRELAATQKEYFATQAALAKAQATIAQLSTPTTSPSTAPATAKIDIEPATEAAQRAQMARRYDALIQRLGLSPADAERFLGLMISRRHAADDVLAAAQTQGDGTSTTAADIAAMVASSRSGIESDLHALLGDAGYAQFQQYEVSAGGTGTVARLQATIAGNAPLSVDQAQQLQQLLNESGVGHVTPQVIAKAQDFLSPAQVQALQSLYVQQRAAQQQRRTGTVPGGTH